MKELWKLEEELRVLRVEQLGAELFLKSFTWRIAAKEDEIREMNLGGKK
jgi:hypothetical protein